MLLCRKVRFENICCCFFFSDKHLFNQIFSIKDSCHCSISLTTKIYPPGEYMQVHFVKSKYIPDNARSKSFCTKYSAEHYTENDFNCYLWYSGKNFTYLQAEKYCNQLESGLGAPFPVSLSIYFSIKQTWQLCLQLIAKTDSAFAQKLYFESDKFWFMWRENFLILISFSAHGTSDVNQQLRGVDFTTALQPRCFIYWCLPQIFLLCC